MHAPASSQFLLLIWKNWLLQKRAVAVTILEIGLPTLFAVILLGTRQAVSVTHHDEGILWPSFSVEDFNGTLRPPSSWGVINDSSPWLLAYSPNKPVVSRVMDRVSSKLGVVIDGEYEPMQRERGVGF